jgi:N-acetyltransferase
VNPIVLQGRFVRLEPLAGKHLEGLRRLVIGFPHAKYPYAHVPKPDALDDYVETALRQPDAIPFATCRPDGEVIGCTRFFDVARWAWPKGLDPRPRHTGYDSCEIGYTWLAPEVQRTRVNTEAKLLMLAHAFDVWGCHRVQLKTDERNDRSRTAILRLGAKFEGILRAMQPAADGIPRNTAYFSILASEWPQVRSKLETGLAAEAPRPGRS